MFFAASSRMFFAENDRQYGNRYKVNLIYAIKGILFHRLKGKSTHSFSSSEQLGQIILCCEERTMHNNRAL
jgi:hypothetical protein